MRVNGEKVQNCSFKFRCTKKWSDLRVINGLENTIRSCEDCNQIVYFVESEQDLAYRVLNSECVAVSKILARRVFDKEILKSINKPLTGSVKLGK